MSTKLQQPENSEQLLFDFSGSDAAQQKALELLACYFEFGYTRQQAQDILDFANRVCRNK